MIETEDIIHFYRALIHEGPCVGLHVMQLIKIGVLYGQGPFAVNLHLSDQCVIISKGAAHRLNARCLYLPEEVCGALRVGVGDCLSFVYHEDVREIVMRKSYLTPDERIAVSSRFSKFPSGASFLQ